MGGTNPVYPVRTPLGTLGPHRRNGLNREVTAPSPMALGLPLRPAACTVYGALRSGWYGTGAHVGLATSLRIDAAVVEFPPLCHHVFSMVKRPACNTAPLVACSVHSGLCRLITEGRIAGYTTQVSA